MTGYCSGAKMQVEFPCPAKACPHYDKCLREYEYLVRVKNQKEVTEIES